MEKRIPPTGLGKLNLEESQNKSVCQVLHFANPLYTMADTFGLVKRALRPEPGQGPDEADGNPVHLLRHPHGECCVV